MSARSGAPKRVLMALYYYHPYTSGLSVYAKRLAEGLVRQGYEVTVLTSRYDESLPERETINGVMVLRRPVWFKLGKGVIMPTFWFDIIRYSRHSDYVNAHLPMPDSGLSALFIPRHKQITTYHCDINLGTGLAERVIGAVSMVLMHLQLWRSAVVVPSSRDYLRHSKMRRYLGKAQPIYPPIDAAEFQPVDSVALFKRLGVGDKTKLIGFVGRVVYEKGINFLLESIEQLSAALDDFKVVIVGDYKNIAGGSIKDQLDEYLKRWPDQIIFTGFLSGKELHQFYSGIDVLVLPSIDPLEAFGMVQVEAMLCGAPVVASDLPGVREVIKQTGYGRIARPKDPADLAEQIIAVISEPKEYAPDRSHVAEVFNADDTIAGYARLMR